MYSDYTLDIWERYNTTICKFFFISAWTKLFFYLVSGDIVVCMCSFVPPFEHTLFRMHVPKLTHPFSTPFLDEPTQMGTFV